LHCALTDETKHLINSERLSIMKPNAVLVNASRGPVIDEAALVKHLQKSPDFRSGMHADLSCPHCSALVKICMHGTKDWPRAVCKEQAVRHP